MKHFYDVALYFEFQVLCFMNLMWLKYPVIILLFFIFSLIKDGILPILGLVATTLNPVFILFFILIFFNSDLDIFFTAIAAGFFLDLYSLSYFGISIVSLFVIYFSQKLINYFFKKGSDKNPVFYFIAAFLINFILYNLLLYLSSIIFDFEYDLTINLTIGIIYNLIAAFAGFYIYKTFVKEDKSEKQLKLL